MRIPGTAALVLLLAAAPSGAETVPRPDPTAGAVIAVKTGEEVTFVDAPGWRPVDRTQVLLSGDTLRTNAYGQLAILFADRTQVRVGRNTTLVVKDVAAGGDARLSLESGAIWARAVRGGTGVTVETPAATAAVRGTDWSLAVAPDGRTALVVLEGAIELSNGAGRLLVREGEAASVAIGQAPTKVVLVRPNDREQMQYYVSLRDAFTYLAPTPLPSRLLVPEKARIAAIPEALRTPEDRVRFAEATFALDGIAAAGPAIAAARAAPLDAARAARLTMLEGLVRGARRDYAGAAAAFAKAAPGLSADQRGVAAYAGFVARGLADPTRAEVPPAVAVTGPYTALADAFLAAFLDGMPAALERLAAAERRFPDEAALPAIRAQVALLVGDRAAMAEAVERAVALAPDDPGVLLARAHYRAEFARDARGAEADLRRAAALQPGSGTVWNALGLLLSDRDAEAEAEAAFRTAMALDPQDPLPRANLAILKLDQNRLDAAKALIDEALARDPALHVAVTARGRWHLQRGETDLALQDLLVASTADPAAAETLVLIAAAARQAGETEAAAQAVDNAARLDPFDPLVPTIATRLAIDDYRADEAIRQARRAVGLARGRGGDHAALSANREEGSVVAAAFGLLDLTAWGRAWSTAVFDPFDPSGYIDQSVAGVADPVLDALDYDSAPGEAASGSRSFSALLQGLALDPLAIAAPRRRTQLLRAPFLEASGGGGFIARDEGLSRIGFADVQGTTTGPVPASVYASVERSLDTDDADTAVGVGSLSGSVFLGAEPTPDDRLLVLAVASDGDTAFTGPDSDRNPFNKRDATSAQGVVAWSRDLGARHVLTTAVSASTVDQESRRFGIVDAGGIPYVARDVTAERADSLLGGVQHMIGFGDLTLRTGLEGGLVRTRRSLTRALYVPDPVEIAETREDASYGLGRAFVDAFWRATPTLDLEAGVFATRLDGGAADVGRLEPRIGAAWTLMEGHTVRLAALRETSLPIAASLAPVGVAGVEANEPPIALGGGVDTLAVRWDAEWSERFFTALEVQHQRFDDATLAVPRTLDAIGFAEGTLDRVSLTANGWLGGGFGAFGTVAYAVSDVAGSDSAIPFVPDLVARAGITYVHPSRVKATLSATYVGERAGDLAGADLDPYTTLDASLTWEPFDRRFELDVSLYNILDEDFDIAPDTPGWGRTLVGRVAVRF